GLYRPFPSGGPPAGVRPCGHSGIAAARKGKTSTQPLRARLPLHKKSDAAWRDVAIHKVTPAQEDDPVTGRIRLVIFQLVVRDDDLCSDVDVFAAQRLVGPGVGDDGDIFVALYFERIRPIRIRFAAT